MKKLFNKMLLAFSCIAGFLFIESCQDDSTLQDNKKTLVSSEAVLESIQAAGFTDIQDMGTYFLVEGDIYFSKKEIYQIHEQAKQQPASNGRTTHYRARNIVAEPYNITVRVDATIPGTGVDNWKDAISQAISDWNTLESTNILFQLTTSTNAEVTISSDNGTLAGTVLSVSSLPPASGAPGSTIMINLDYSSNKTITDSQKRYQMVHELGHTLGIRHTDWETIGETRDGAIQIPNTPSGINDVSVMTSFTRSGLKDWIGWREYDPMTAQFIFPQPHLYAIKNDRLLAVNEVTGASYRISNGGFSGLQAMTSLYGYETRLFVVKNGNFYKINRKTGQTAQLGASGILGNVRAMTATGGLSLGGNQIYAIDGSILRKIDPGTGSLSTIGGLNDWPETYVLSSYMVSPSDGVVNQGLFAIVEEALYGIKVPNTLQRFPGTSLKAFINNSTEDWTSASAMVCLPDSPRMNYIIAGRSLYKVGEFAGGTFSMLGTENEWNGPIYMTFYKKNLYIISDGTLYEFNTTTNVKKRIGDTGAWAGTIALVNAPNNVTNPQ